MALGDLTQALALATIAQDGGIVQRERSAADGPAFETGATHAGTHALDDQVVLKFDRAILSEAQTRTTSKRPRRASAII